MTNHEHTPVAWSLPGYHVKHCRMKHLLMFACNKVRKLTWSTGRQKRGLSLDGINHPDMLTCIHPERFMKTAHLTCLQSQAPVSWQEGLTRDRKGLWDFPVEFTPCVSRYPIRVLCPEALWLSEPAQYVGWKISKNLCMMTNY